MGSCSQLSTDVFCRLGTVWSFLEPGEGHLPSYQEEQSLKATFEPFIIDTA